MILWIALLCVVSMVGVRFSKYHEDYLSKDSTNAIKGIFAVVILYSHMRGYLDLSSGWYNTAYVRILKSIGQMMVAPFLFYSGYGIMESLKHNEDYSRHFFKRRIVKTWLHFVLAVLLFIVVQTPIGKVYPAYKYATCWFAWESVENSNWFVFAILALYLEAYLAMLLGKKLSKENKSKDWIFVLLCTVVLYLFLYFAKKGQPWWYNTLFVFPFGMIYSYYKELIDNKIGRDSALYYLTLAGLLFGFGIWYHYYGVDIYGVSSILFTIILVVMGMKVKLGNPILDWLGTNAFAIYILQRLPMNILAHYGYNENVIMFSVVSVVVALLIAVAFTWFLKMVDSKLFAVQNEGNTVTSK